MSITQKVISLKTQIGRADLLFNLVDDKWVCNLEAEFMDDLQTFLSGELPRERVRWVDLPTLGIDDGTDLPTC
jgi:hypothetical protein